MNVSGGVRLILPRIFNPVSAVILGAAIVTGCSRSEVKVQNVPKDADAPPAMAANPANAPDQPPMSPHGQMDATPSGVPQLKYVTPVGWTEKPPSQFRAASFSVSGPDGATADVAVTPMPAAGQESQIVNMWRTQLQMPPLNGEDPNKDTETVTVGSDSGKLFNMVGDRAAEDGKGRTRMMIAMLRRGTTSWFFKITGDDSFVTSEKPVFLEFLKSVSFDSGGAMAPAGGNPHDFMTGAGDVSAAGTAPGPATWTTPTDWKSVPPTQFLVAKYVIQGEGGAKAEVNASVLDREGGGTLMNVNRWRGQLGLPPVDESALAGQTTSLDTPGGKATLVEISGTDKSGGKARLIGVILPQAGQTWFYKLMGDEKTVNQQKEAFVKFIQSAKYSNAP